MKQLSTTLLLVVVLLITLLSSSFAQIIWTKDTLNNPVLEPGSPGTWDSEWIFCSGVLFDSSIYKMWYTGYDINNLSIGYASSLDGINWTKLSNPVLEGDPNTWAQAVDNATVINDGNIYHMWFRGDSVNTYGIGYATSPDGILWTKNPNVVLDVGPPGSWDGLWVLEPKVIFDNVTFRMWYTGWDGVGTPRIGYATSLDGINWTKYDDPSTVNPPYAESDPVMNPGEPGSWDAANVTNPIVYYDGTVHHMWYTGGDTLNPGMPWAVTGKIGYASSPDGITWTKFNNPVLEPGTGSDWDNVTLGGGDVVYYNNNYQMWYSGGGWDGTFRYRIGYATAPRNPGIINIPNDYPTIQAGINAAVDGDTVLVADSTYYENINFKGKAITVASHYYFDGDTSHISNTIIDGSDPSHPDSGSVVYFVSGEDTTSILCGFTITGGSGTYSVGFDMYLGGGIQMQAGGKVMYNKITGNHLVSQKACWGAGMLISSYNMSANIVIEHNEFKYNSVVSPEQSGSAGIHIPLRWWTGGYCRVKNNNVSYNFVTVTGTYKAIGGGINLSFTLPTTGEVIIESNIISHNELHCVASVGAGIYVSYWDPGYSIVDDNPTPIIRNNIITNNYSESLGGGIAIWTVEYGDHYPNSNIKPQPAIINNTIVNNSAADGSGLFSFDSYPLLLNNILWNDLSIPGSNEIFDININFPPYVPPYHDPYNDGEVFVRYSDIQDTLWPGIGNINNDPFFTDSVFNLADSSLCIGAGIDSIEIGGTWYYAPPFDYDGDPRPNPVDMYVDIGAQESFYPNPTGIIKEDSEYLPKTFSLKQNYPNPFNPITNIQFSIPKTEFVTLKIYNLLGQEVATLVTEKLKAGTYNYSLDASTFASGVYFYKLEAGDYIKTKKLILLK